MSSTTPPAQTLTPGNHAKAEGHKPRNGHLLYDSELAVLICERIATIPQSILKLCKAPDMPGVATIFRWLREYPEFRDLYVFAKQAQAELLIEQSLDIVDDTSVDYFLADDENGRITPNPAAIQRARLQVDFRKWMASKLLPRKYGDHQESSARFPDPQLEPAKSSGVILISQMPSRLQPARQAQMEPDPTSNQKPLPSSNSTVPPSTPPPVPASPHSSDHPRGPSTPSLPNLPATPLAPISASAPPSRVTPPPVIQNSEFSIQNSSFPPPRETRAKPGAQVTLPPAIQTRIQNPNPKFAPREKSYSRQPA